MSHRCFLNMGSRLYREMIEIDGRLGEGGGQILRTALALASVLGKEIRVSNIRAGRSKPGIMAQHLTGVTASAEICDASTDGAEVGSDELVYRPAHPRGGRYFFDIGTAGSVTLVLQTLMPFLVFARESIEVRLKGGTDVRWSPPVDYLQRVTLPILRRMGYDGDLHVAKRGHYPKGGGEVHFSSLPVKSLQVLVGTVPGGLTRIDGVSHVTGLPRQVAERQATSAVGVISSRGFPVPNITVDDSSGQTGHGPGSGIVLWGTTTEQAFLGADSLGERGKPAEEVGVEAGSRLVEEVESGMFLDRHMGDMIVPYLALADGLSEVSVSEVTQHTLTNVTVAELVAGVHFQVHGSLGKPGILRVKGLGLASGMGSSSSTEAVRSSHL